MSSCELRICDWSSDVCSSDRLIGLLLAPLDGFLRRYIADQHVARLRHRPGVGREEEQALVGLQHGEALGVVRARGEMILQAEFVGELCAAELPTGRLARHQLLDRRPRSEEHTSELQSLMRISYADSCLKKKINT